MSASSSWRFEQLLKEKHMKRDISRVIKIFEFLSNPWAGINEFEGKLQATAFVPVEADTFDSDIANFSEQSC